MNVYYHQDTQYPEFSGWAFDLTLPFTKHSRWFWSGKFRLFGVYFIYPRDGYFKAFVRWLYTKTLDELYIPQGTKVIRKYGNALHNTKDQITGGRVCAYGPNRKGMQEWFFDFE